MFPVRSRSRFPIWEVATGDLVLNAVGFITWVGPVLAHWVGMHIPRDVPRSAVLAAVDGETLASLSVTVTRARTEVATGLPTVGSLLYADVQPTAWIEVRSQSQETLVLEGCGSGEAVCGDECVDILYDHDNCGGCDQPCSGECESGRCFGGGGEDNNAACDDGLDNDQDGYFDCDDFDCSMNPAVTVCPG